MVLQQVRHRYASNFVWPIWFDRVHVLGLFAVFLLAAEVLRDLIRPEAHPASPLANEPPEPGTADGR